MSSPAETWSEETDNEFLESLRSRYEAEGFTFTIAPDRSAVPSFLGSYTPDALAQKEGQNVAIEVKRHQSQLTQARLQEIRQLFDGHPDWRFTVLFTGSGPLQSVTIPTAKPEAIKSRVDEVRRLSKRGYRRPAFIMAWSLLEAALQAVDKGNRNKPRTPGTVLQTLTMNGHIEAYMERQLRALIELRNRIVHGDVAAEPTAENVKLVLEAVEATLATDAA